MENKNPYESVPEDTLFGRRHYHERQISNSINEINLINIEISRRVGEVAVPEFGKPFVVHDELSSEQLSFEHDSFLDGLPPEGA